MNSRSLKLFSVVIILIGFSSVFAQSLLIRELLVVFYGNEIAVGILLAFWLFWTGAGSLAGAGLLKRKPSRSLFYSVYIIFSIIIILELFLVRDIRVVFHFEPGEIISPFVIFSVSALILSPFAIINGLLFYLCIQIVSGKMGDKSIGFVYSLDALGDMLGGIIFSYLFVFLFSPLMNLYIVMMINLFFILIISLVERIKARVNPVRDRLSLDDRLISNGVKITVFLLFFAFSLFGFLVKPAGNYLVKREWHGFNVLGVKSSLYGNLLLTKRGNTYSLYENGVMAFTFPFRMDSEESVHFPLLESRPVYPVRNKTQSVHLAISNEVNPVRDRLSLDNRLISNGVKRVLIIGSGVRGLLSEVLKYPVSEVDYLELDPALINFVRKYLPPVDKKSLNDPRIKIFNIEARVFLNHYRGNKFDAVLLNTPAPYTAYLNRFYTYEFFDRIKSILNYGGVLSFTLPSKEDYLTREMRNFNASIYHTLRKVFHHIILIPGNKLRFIASSSSEFLTYDPDVLSKRMAQYGLKTEFVNRYYFKMKLLPWHINYVRHTLNNTTRVRLNYDFKPVSYYYGMELFFSRFRSHLRKPLNVLAKVNAGIYFIAIFLFILSIFIVHPVRDRLSLDNRLISNGVKNRHMLDVCVFSMGALGMGSVVLSVLGYQIVFGYVYHKIGLISAVFMLGAALGAAWANRKIKYPKIKMMIYSLLLGGAYMICVPYVFKIFQHALPLSEIVSLFLPFFMGCIVGFIFPLANRLYNRKKELSVSGVGFLYFCDLLGGAAAGVTLSLIFIPLYGLFMSAGIISFIAFVCGGFLLLGYHGG